MGNRKTRTSLQGRSTTGDLTTSTKMADENMDIEQETPAPVEVIDAEPLDTVSALKQVLKKALCADGLARGIRECAKMLDKRAVHLCVLADNSTSQHTRSSSRLCAPSTAST